MTAPAESESSAPFCDRDSLSTCEQRSSSCVERYAMLRYCSTSRSLMLGSQNAGALANASTHAAIVMRFMSCTPHCPHWDVSFNQTASPLYEHPPAGDSVQLKKKGSPREGGLEA